MEREEDEGWTEEGSEGMEKGRKKKENGMRKGELKKRNNNGRKKISEK